MKKLSSLMAYALAAALFGVSTWFGCSPQHETRVGPIPVDQQDQVSRNMNDALRGTVGEFATLVDSAPIPVEGYGVVVNLHGAGSGDMDPKIREYLVNRLLVAGADSPMAGTQNIDPERILASNNADIAVVEVRGIVPAMARKGSSFDLTINALPGSQVTSLANGLLWTSELKVIGLTTGGNDTATVAYGRGPVFIASPVEAAAGLIDPANAPKALRVGHVLGGGKLNVDRPIRLQVYTASSRMTRVIEYAINSRFAARDKVAQAENESLISLRIPPEYNLNPSDFIDVVKHLYLSTETEGFTQNKATELINEIQKPGTPHAELALALQGLGRSVLPDYIQKQYTSSNPELQFWCAKAGAGLQDVQGMALLQEIVKNRSSAFRTQALDAMITTSLGRDTEAATLTLSKLLDSPNTDERVRAYFGLLAIRSQLVLTYKIPADVPGSPPREPKFFVDVVPSDSAPMVYVTQSQVPRIAFIGRPLALPVGGLYLSSDKRFMVNAGPIANNGHTVVASDVGSSAAPGTAVVTVPAAKDNVVMLLTPPASVHEEFAIRQAAAYQRAKDPNATLSQRDFANQDLARLVKQEQDATVQIRTSSYMPALIARAAWEPDPADKQPQPYIGVSYQRITEMLGQLCQSQVLDARFILQPAPPPLLTPSELLNSGRPEGRTIAPTSQPVIEAPATQAAPSLPALPAMPAVPVAPSAPSTLDTPVIPGSPSLPPAP